MFAAQILRRKLVSDSLHPSSAPSLAWWFGPFLLAVLSIGVMSPLIGAGFTDWDDPMTVSRNPSFNPPTIGSLKPFWTNIDQPYMQIYDPLTNSLWALLAKIAPRHPAGADGVTMSATPFHVASILLHGASAILVFLILRRLIANEITALAGAILFAIHPVQVEAVAWISGAKDVLSGMLALLAIWQYICAVQRKSWISYGVGMLAFIAAMLAKPSAVCVPLILLAIDCFVLRRRLRVIVRWLWPWFVLTAPIIWIGQLGQPANLVHSPLWLRPIIACDAITFYLGKLIWPARLCIDYGHSPYWLMHVAQRGWIWSIALIVPLAAVAMCALLYRRARLPLGALAIFMAALIPTLGLIPFEFQLHSTTADHYLYLAMLAPAILVAIGLGNVSSAKWLVPGIAVMVIFGCLSFRQCSFWKDNLTLMTHALDANPSSLAANNFLGFYYDQQHPPDMAKAGPYFQKALADHPNVPWVHFNDANFLMHAGRMDEAIEQYRQAIALDLKSEDSWINYGRALALKGRDQDAANAFANAIELKPDDARAYKNMGLIWANHGDVEQARKYFIAALRIDPNQPALVEYLREHPVEGR